MSSKRGFLTQLGSFLAPLLGTPLIGLLYLTVRIVNGSVVQQSVNRRPRPTGVFVFWHSHQLSALWHYRRTRSAILVSRSRDGEIVARIAASAGYRPVRGSSSRGGSEGLKEIIQIAQSGAPVAVTPDGPRGPRYSIGPGLMLLAQKSGHPITPVAIGLSRFWELPSWDRFRIPKPFAKGFNCWGEPLHVPADADRPALDRLARKLQQRMIALEKHADQCAARM